MLFVLCVVNKFLTIRFPPNPSQARILRLEAELDKARGDLHGMRKQRYEGGAGGRPSS